MDQGFEIDGWCVIPIRNCLEKGGKRITLKPRSMEVLVQLLTGDGAVLTRSELLNAVWGKAVVTEDVLTQSIVEIRKAFGDHARDPTIIETIRKVGFRVIPDVRAIQIDRPEIEAQSHFGVDRYFADKSWRQRSWVIGLGGFLALFLWFFVVGYQPHPQEPSIAVLPFVNLSEDAGNDYFSNGLSEDLLLSLARTPGLQVSARTSSFALANRGLDIPAIGEQLGVSWVLEGSVRKTSQRFRVSAQLVDAITGYPVWSNTYDRDLTDLFEVQEQISTAIIDAVSVNLDSAVASYSGHLVTPEFEAYDLYLLGRHCMNQGEFDCAIERFEQSITMDDSFARAYTGLAESLLAFRETSASFWQPGSSSDLAMYGETLARADELIDTAVTLDPYLAEAYLARAEVMEQQEQRAAQLENINRALELDPDSARAYGMLGHQLMREQRYDQAEQAYLRALQLDPFNPVINAGISRLTARLGKYEEANRYLLRLIENETESPLVYEVLMQNANDFGRYTDRIRWGLELVQLAPQRSAALAEMGDAYSQIGMLDLADHWISAAEAIDPLQAYKARQRWLWTQHRYTDFLALARRAIAANPPLEERPLTPAQAAILGIAAIANLQAGKQELSVRYLTRLLQESTAMTSRGVHLQMYALAFLARAYRADGEEFKASLAISEALESGENYRRQLRGPYPPLLRELAVHQILQGKPEQAVQILKQAVNAGWKAWLLEGHQPGSDPNWRAIEQREDYQQLGREGVEELAQMRNEVIQNGWNKVPQFSEAISPDA